MVITKDDFWTSNIHPNHVHKHKVGNLNSKHLANIIHFFKTVGPEVHGHEYSECFDIVGGMQEIAKERGLSPEFLAAAPYFYDPEAPYEEYVENI